MGGAGPRSIRDLWTGGTEMGQRLLHYEGQKMVTGACAGLDLRVGSCPMPNHVFFCLVVLFFYTLTNSDRLQQRLPKGL